MALPSRKKFNRLILTVLLVGAALFLLLLSGLGAGLLTTSTHYP
jgi:hypothetical protein